MISKEPLSLGEVSHKAGTNFRWTIVAFTLAGALMAGLAIWQLYQMSPQLYCKLAEGSASDSGCVVLLMKLLDLKDHALMGTLMILGLTVLSVVAVALGVSIKATGPGGTSVDLATQTPPTVISQGDTDIVIPSPPQTTE